MNNVLRRIGFEDIVIYQENQYSKQTHVKCAEIFTQLVKEGKFKGRFDKGNWTGSTEIRYHEISFNLDEATYQLHVGKEYNIPVSTMQDMLRCYTVYCIGVYIIPTINDKIQSIIRFLTEFGEKSLKITHAELMTIEDFLGFINTPDHQIDDIIARVRVLKVRKKTVRQLSHLINYLAVENEINLLFASNLGEEMFIHWFPIYFWVNITFILPLRATEMLVTPFDCLRNKDGKTFLMVRRTKLKKGLRTVYYSVEKDYELFTYEMPDQKVVKNILKYQELTNEHNRRFLFSYSKFCINEMFSSVSFNKLLEEFIHTHLVGNRNYDFARYATGIEEFEPVTAGDSRPIAMSNLFFQGAGADICRQLADHENINTSASYYTNVTETLMCSSIMQLQKRLNYKKEQDEQAEKICVSENLIPIGITCLSPKRERNLSDIEDCIEQGRLEECFGCKYYVLSEKEADRFLKELKEETDSEVKKIIEFLNNTAKVVDKDIDIDKILLKVQTKAGRYKLGCDVKTKETLERWQEHKSIATSYC